MTRLLGGILTLTLLGACESAPSASENRERLDTWRQEGPSSYTWTLLVADQQGVRRIRVQVEEGEPGKTTVNGEPVPIGSPFDPGTPPDTVDELIGWLIRYGPDAESIEVEWDEELGYPTMIAIDHTDGTDDEMSFRVVSFEVE